MRSYVPQFRSISALALLAVLSACQQDSLPSSAKLPTKNPAKTPSGGDPTLADPVDLSTDTKLFTAYQQLPSSFQLFPRDAQNQASVHFSGTIYRTILSRGQVDLTKFDSVRIKVFVNTNPYEEISQALNYTGEVEAKFDLNYTIKAGLKNYRFEIWFVNSTSAVLDRTIDQVVCGDVFLVNGQSNALSAAGPDEDTSENPWIRSFGNSTIDPTLSQEDNEWRIAQDDLPNAPGSIGMLWMLMGNQLISKYQVPVAFINGSVGGTHIEDHFKNTSNPTDPTTIYGRLLGRVQRAGVQQNIKALFWFQGENNTDDTYIHYTTYFDQLYQSWAVDYPTVQKIYMFQIRPGCGGPYQREMREIQRTLVKSYSNVKLIASSGVIAHIGCHFIYGKENLLPFFVYRQVSRDIYGDTEFGDIESPDVVKAYYTNSQKNQIAIQFTGTVPLAIEDSYTYGDQTHYLREAFLLDGQPGLVDSIYANGNTVFLQLNGTVEATTVSYLPSMNYPGTSTVYEGPWIYSSNGLSIFGFNAFPISE